MKNILLDSLESLLSAKRQRLSLTRSLRSRIVLKREIQSLRHGSRICEPDPFENAERNHVMIFLLFLTVLYAGSFYLLCGRASEQW
ncbi:MAG: hypothetical protein WDN28_02645 [Chthoniobacter sp.]